MDELPPDQDFPALGVEVEFDEDHKTLAGYSVSLPRERSKAVGLTTPPDDLTWEVTDRHRLQYQKFERNALRYDALGLLGKYVDRTIPDPLHSLGAWIATTHTYPQTLFRINVGNTETINGFNHGTGEVHLYISAEHRESERRFEYWKSEGVTPEWGTYGICSTVPLVCLTCPSPRVASMILDDDVILDCAYWLNRALIIARGDQLRKRNNPLMSSDVLAAAWDSARPRCPQCGERSIPILYGMPDDRLQGQAEAGQATIGGCILTPENPTWACSGPERHRWGRLGDS